MVDPPHSWRAGRVSGAAPSAFELIELDREPQRAHHLAGRRGDTRRAHDRRDGSEDAADLLFDADLTSGFEVQQIRGRRRVDRDQRSDANEHQRLRVEAGRLQRISGHLRE
jgi:hypothetical protein